MIDKEELNRKMKERGFDIYCYNGENEIQYMTEFNPDNKNPTINITVYLDEHNFKGIYVIPHSINKIETPICGSVMNDKHFDRIIMKLESHARILERFVGGLDYGNI